MLICEIVIKLYMLQKQETHCIEYIYWIKFLSVENHFYTNNHTVEHFPVIGLEKLYHNEFYIKKNRENLCKAKLNTL
jgi:hypothetical protein